MRAQSAEEYYNIGLNYLEQGKLGKAIEAFKQAVKLDPNFIEAYFELSIVYYASRLNDAIMTLKKLIELKPDHVEAYLRLGLYYYQLKKYEEAIEELNKVIKLKPDYPDAYWGLGIVYSALERFDKAKEVLEKAIKIEPDFLAGYFLLGSTYFELKEWKKVIEVFNKLINMDKIKKKDEKDYKASLDQLVPYDRIDVILNVFYDMAEIYYLLGVAYLNLNKLIKELKLSKKQ